VGYLDTSKAVWRNHEKARSNLDLPQWMIFSIDRWREEPVWPGNQKLKRGWPTKLRKRSTKTVAGAAWRIERSGINKFLTIPDIKVSF